MSKKNLTSGKAQSRDLGSKAKPLPTLPLEASKSIGLRWPVLIALFVTILGFSSSIKNEFVSWDDDKNIYENQDVLNFDMKKFGESTKRIFTSHVIGNYNPLPILTFALEKHYIGIDKPHRWHLHNLILHLGCVLLVYMLGLRLGLSWAGALLLSTLFGIHPLRVESVAWVTERKDVLFGIFYLAALLVYTKHKDNPKAINWLWITVLFILSLFSKIQAVSLPLSMLAIDYFKDKQWTWSRVTNKIPFLLLSIAFGIYGVMKLKENGSISADTDADFNMFQRLFIGAFSFIIYLIKWLIPFRMVPMYPYPSTFPVYFYPCILIAPITLWVLYKAWQKEQKALVFGLVFFIVNIVFLLQILGAGQGYLADRFTYIAYFGLFFLTAYYTDEYIKSQPGQRGVVLGVLAAYVFGLTFMTYSQGKIWKNSETLWSHVIDYYPNTTLPFGNRANYYRDLKMYDKAFSDYNHTIQLSDKQPQAFNSRARMFFDMAGNSRDTLLMALADYNKAIELLPKDGEFRINRGATYARLGDIPKAIADMNDGLKLKPDHAVGYLNRSLMYRQTGELDKALGDINTYLKMNPNNADMTYEKGQVLFFLKRNAEAITEHGNAIALGKGNKNLGLFYYERSKLFAVEKKMEEAKADYRQAVDLGFTNIDPNFKNYLGL
jgi:protein O-mannosyl-transferase